MAVESKETKKTPTDKRVKETTINLEKVTYSTLGVTSYLLGATPFAMLFAGLALFPPKREPYKPHLLDKLGAAIEGVTKPGKYI